MPSHDATTAHLWIKPLIILGQRTVETIDPFILEGEVHSRLDQSYQQVPSLVPLLLRLTAESRFRWANLTRLEFLNLTEAEASPSE